MKFGTMLGDIWQSFFKKPVTQRYPFERLEAPDQYRGKLVWTAGKCNGCCLCMKDCPANAIELITIDKKAKQFVMRYYADRCTYCAQCVVSCNFDAIGMSHEQWELAALSQTPFAVTFGREEDITAMREQAAAQAVQGPAPVVPPAPATA